MILQNLSIDKSWSLFLDRDGVINKRLEGDYVKKWEEFEFLPGVLKSLAVFNKIFGKIFIVTNQQGIGKGLMLETELEVIHDRMNREIQAHGGKINKTYYSPYKAEENSVFRKPNTGLARKAKIDFPEIAFEKSIMAGDSITDMQFGKNAGMFTVLIGKDKEFYQAHKEIIDLMFPDLEGFAEFLTLKS
ncbi:MAG: HAD-IIIA family hydrolase [Bacteroidales bacterium]|nr:HAD-IIIA family hydrolase [Bacteroidales bacterium]